MAFYLCWLPNLVNGILLWSTWPQVPVQPVVGIWYFMVSGGPMLRLRGAEPAVFRLRGAEPALFRFRRC